MWVMGCMSFNNTNLYPHFIEIITKWKFTQPTLNRRNKPFQWKSTHDYVVYHTVACNDAIDRFASQIFTIIQRFRQWNAVGGERTTKCGRYHSSYTLKNIFIKWISTYKQRNEIRLKLFERINRFSIFLLQFYIFILKNMDGVDLFL